MFIHVHGFGLNKQSESELLKSYKPKLTETAVFLHSDVWEYIISARTYQQLSICRGIRTFVLFINEANDIPVDIFDI